MRPAQRRVAVRWLRERLGFSERRERLRELAARRPRFGYRRLHALLRREGLGINHKRVARLYRDD